MQKSFRVKALYSKNFERSSNRSRHENSKVLDHTLSVEEIIGRDEEIPADCAKPRQFVRPIHDVADGNDLMKTFDLDQ